MILGWWVHHKFTIQSNIDKTFIQSMIEKNQTEITKFAHGFADLSTQLINTMRCQQPVVYSQPDTKVETIEAEGMENMFEAASLEEPLR